MSPRPQSDPWRFNKLKRRTYMFVSKYPALRSLFMGLVAAIALVANPLAGHADEHGLKLIGALPNPGATHLAVDISYVDHQTNRYFVADVSNKAVDVFDAE